MKIISKIIFIVLFFIFNCNLNFSNAHENLPCNQNLQLISSYKNKETNINKTNKNTSVLINQKHQKTLIKNNNRKQTFSIPLCELSKEKIESNFCFINNKKILTYRFIPQNSTKTLKYEKITRAP